jgi:outer membrane protein assembly factor BamB
MKTNRVYLLLITVNLFMLACFGTQNNRTRSAPFYTLDKNDEYAVIWHRNDMITKYFLDRPDMVGTEGMIIILGNNEKDFFSNGYLYGLDSLSGEVLWESRAGAGSMIVDKKQIYYGDVGQATVKCYNTENGELVWQTTIPVGKSVHHLYATEDAIFVYTSTSKFFALNKEGQIIGNFKELQNSYAVYLKIDDVVYMNHNLNIKAVDTTLSQEFWRTEVGPYTVAPIFDDGTIFITGWNNILSLKQSTGRISWTVPNEALSNLYITDRKIYYISKDSSLVSLDRVTGNEISRVEFLPKFDFGGARTGGFYVAGDPSNDVIVISFANSKQIMGLKVLNP